MTLLYNHKYIYNHIFIMTQTTSRNVVYQRSYIHTQRACYFTRIVNSTTRSHLVRIARPVQYM